MSDKRWDVSPLRSQGSLTEELARRIADQILSGKLTSNERLPTVQEMAQTFGVSRTVVRETVAKLKADGFITVRHGAGMFVASDLRHRPLRIDPSQVTGIRDMVEIMQVRLGLEVEAAGLSAMNRGTADLRRINSALRAMIAAARKQQLAVEEDRLFHSHIATSTGNQYFVTFLEFLGRYIIPRGSIRIGSGTALERASYMEQLEEEHGRIYQAIERRDAEMARHAMRQHLRRGLERLEQMEPEELSDANRAILQRRPAKS
ncbi:MAG: FadR/GntR family transcriptional regulator [Parvibaculaceae bacterium]